MHPLVSVGWLAEHLDDPDLILLDATLPPVGVQPAPDVHARFLAGHLPGALWFDIEALSDHSTTLPHMLPTPTAFAEAMSALGVRDDAHLVVYEQDAVFSAPRARWMLRTMGVARVHMLEGGLQAWLEAGLPTEAGATHRPRTHFHARLQPGAVRTLAEVTQLTASLHSSPREQNPGKQTLDEQHGAEQILDARSAARFAGTASEPRPGLRSGHMPGALSLPYTELLQAGRLKTPDDLRRTFAAHGVDLARPVITTCGSGVTAAVLSLGLELCGTANVSLYDGSWAEYASAPDAAIHSANPSPTAATPQG